MEKIFHMLPCTEAQKVTFATFTLKEDAQEWWLLILEREEITTWARITTRAKGIGILTLRAGNNLVAEYESKFTRLARFATYIIPMEDRKERKFEAGLDEEIKGKIKVMKLPNYAEMVNLAYIMEK
ncbi:uncharacterized protein LOC114297720 [Camellia sinensis]|uniref:uncharacterized protein LOC114297720 n=1 Tax=Camellia sinensis TaxID=4442 RepID=UPI0010355331|nr:uncharacterized protein LOC114297720 [Camellia sinensis]